MALFDRVVVDLHRKFLNTAKTSSAIDMRCKRHSHRSFTSFWVKEPGLIAKRQVFLRSPEAIIYGLDNTSQYIENDDNSGDQNGEDANNDVEYIEGSCVKKYEYGLITD